MRRLWTIALIALLAACDNQAPTPTVESRNPPTLAAPDRDPAAALLPITRETIARIGYRARLTQPESEAPATLFTHAIDRDSTRLVALGDTLMYGWTLETGESLFATSRLDIVRILFSADGTQLYGITADATVLVLDAATGAGVDNFPGIDSPSGVIAYHSGRGLLALGSSDGRVKVWDVAARTALATLTIDSAPVSGIAFTPDGETLVAASGTTLRRLSWRSREVTALTPVERAVAVSNVAVSPDGLWAAASTDFNAVLWSMGDPDRLVALDAGAGGANQLLTFSPDGGYLVASSRVSGLTVWDIAGGSLTARLPLTSSVSTAAAFLPGDSLLITAGLDIGVSLWNLAEATGQTIQQAALDVGTSRIHDAAWTPDARRLLLFDASGAVYVWGVG